MKIAVVGAGAIGLFYGSELQRTGQEIHFLFRSDYETARQRGIRVEKKSEVYDLISVNAHKESSTIGLCDLVLIALKTTSNAALADILVPLVGPETILLTLQNGLGSDDLLAGIYPANPVLGGLCFICLNRIGPAVVRNPLDGSITIGPRNSIHVGQARIVANLFSKAGIDARASENLALIQWKKLVWNVPFNGLTIALGGVTTDVIVSNETICREASALMDEIVEGARVHGLLIEETHVSKQIDFTKPMGQYRPSSMIDFVEGKKVEVEAIWGEPLRRAQAQGLPMPKLEMLYTILKLLCRS